MEWSQILVIVLSIVLIIFLILAAVLVGLLIRITKQIKSITETAERAVNGLESAVSSVNKLASPLAVLKFVAGRIKHIKHSRR